MVMSPRCGKPSPAPKTLTVKGELESARRSEAQRMSNSAAAERNQRFFGISDPLVAGKGSRPSRGKRASKRGLKQGCSATPCNLFNLFNLFNRLYTFRRNGCSKPHRQGPKAQSRAREVR